MFSKVMTGSTISNVRSTIKAYGIGACPFDIPLHGRAGMLRACEA